MPKATLIERNAVSNELYILQRGMLHVHAAAAEDGKASRKKFGAKAALRFRAVEKMGAFVGFYDPYDFRIRLPLEVVAQKLSQLFAINRLDLLDVLDAVGEGEANAVLKVLDDEKNLVLKALKVDRRSISVADPSSVPDLAAVAAEAEEDAMLGARSLYGQDRWRNEALDAVETDDDSEGEPGGFGPDSDSPSSAMGTFRRQQQDALELQQQQQHPTTTTTTATTATTTTSTATATAP